MAYPKLESGVPVVELTDSRATNPALVGAKAAALARAAGAGLPTLPGFVLTTAWEPASRRDLEPWRALSQDGQVSLVVRSSSTAEDGVESSMAGLFTSVLDVRGRDAFDTAVREVLDSRTQSGPVDAPMAVLVQPFLDPRWGGVLFGADPVTGRRDRFVVSAVPGGPDALVSGAAAGWTAALTTHGHIEEVRGGDGPRPSRAQLRALAHLARRAGRVFGGPQDIEWVIAADGALYLLQSRPITTLPADVSGPVFGPGPVAETFPVPLAPLERDLWLRPLAEGLREALALTGSASKRDLSRSPVVIDVDGSAAVDLDLLGARSGRTSLLRRLDPRPPARRLRAAWQVGRLRAALPDLSREIVTKVDRDLAAVPGLDELGNRTLLAILDNGRETLKALHGYEALAGLLVPAQASGVTAASMALTQLAEARAEGVGCTDLLQRNPLVLALLPPRIGAEPELPSVAVHPSAEPSDVDTDPGSVAREALRLRARWVQELTARAAAELGRRLATVGVLPDRTSVRLLTLDELRTALSTRTRPEALEAREPAGAALPHEFHLSSDGRPMPVSGAPTGAATGAGGGVGRGPVHVGADAVPAPGSVLVVSHLDPRLAPAIPHLAGLVAETGSPLSHLAILAREHGVPTVVGFADATQTWRPGQFVVVDGGAGTVTPVEIGSPAGSPASDEVIDIAQIEMGAAS